MPRRICDITADINRDWKRPGPRARRCLLAMQFVVSTRDIYGNITGHELCRRFLEAAGAWKGPVAARIKAELRELSALRR